MLQVPQAQLAQLDNQEPLDHWGPQEPQAQLVSQELLVVQAWQDQLVVLDQPVQQALPELVQQDHKVHKDNKAIQVVQQAQQALLDH